MHENVDLVNHYFSLFKKLTAGHFLKKNYAPTEIIFEKQVSNRYKSVRKQFLI
jgi:hypothetical protein